MMVTMMVDLVAALLSRLRGEAGQGLAEYTLVLALMLLGALLSLGVLVGIVTGYIGDAGNAFP